MPRKTTRLVATIDLTASPPWDVTGLGDASQLNFATLGLTGGKVLIVQPSTDGGSSFDTTATNWFRTLEGHSTSLTDQTITGFQLGGNVTGEANASIYNFNVAARSFSFARPSWMSAGPLTFGIGMHQINSVAYNAIRVTTSDGLPFTTGTLYVTERRDVLSIIENNTSLTGLSSYDVDVTGFARVNFYIQGGLTVGTLSASVVPSDDGGTTERGAGTMRQYLTPTTGSVAAVVDSGGCPITSGLSNSFMRSFGVVSNVDMSVPTVLENCFSTNGNSQGHNSWSCLFTQVAAHDTLRFKFNAALNNASPALQVVGVPNS